MTRKNRNPWPAAVLLMAALGIWSAGCDSEPRLSPPAREFRAQLLAEFRHMAEPVSKAAAAGDRAALDRLLERFCLEKFCDPFHKKFGAVVLDGQGRFLSGRYRDQESGGRVRDMEAKRADYSRYQIASRLRMREVAQARLYDPSGPILVVCAPYSNYSEGDGLQASLCLSFPEDSFQREWGLSPDEFLSLDFN